MPASSAPAPRRASPLQRLWRHPLWAPLNDVQAWDRLARVFNRNWSFTESRGRVHKVVDEAPGVCSVWLKPNRRFHGFAPGQHVLLELEIDGSRQGRCFSLSHAPRADGLLRLTIKAKPDGPVSAAAHRLQPGQVVRLGRAQGDFAPRTDGALLLLAAGSGITPFLPLLQTLAAEAPGRDVVLLYSVRSEADLIFAAELEALEADFPGLCLLRHFSQAQGRLDADAIAAQVGNWRERETLLCGPDGFMATVEAMFDAAGLRDRLQSESFGRRAAPIDPDAAEHAVQFGAEPKTISARAGQSLLDAAEAAGLSPRFGCRRGICRSCQCRKQSGTVTNLLTGEQSGPGEEWIQLCISTPNSAVELTP
jgi:stearoyl-CoA 9-desaturase NADPH oxidoreductase